MIDSLNYKLTVKVVTTDLISAFASGPAHSTDHVAFLASRHKTWPA